ncbi:MAG: band-7 C-terminal domain-containing protein [Bilophila wadsworthia]
MKNQAEGDAVLIRAVARPPPTALPPSPTRWKSRAYAGGEPARCGKLSGTVRQLAKEGNTMILPTDLANISGLVSSLTSVIKQAKA